MCGITGFVGSDGAIQIALESLKRLEYRGYDSVGVAYPQNNHIAVVRSAGKINRLLDRLDGEVPDVAVAIAHTRWATHGQPTEANAHPHRDCSGELAVAHNGIIENYDPLRDELQRMGHRFSSETDTEVLPHLIEHYLSKTSDLVEAVRLSLRRVEGSYAIAVVSTRYPGGVIVARKDSPLVIGLAEGSKLIASDIPAVLPYVKDVLILEDGDVAAITPETVTLSDISGKAVHRSPTRVGWRIEEAEKGGYSHYMLKEIHEEPAAVRNALRGRIYNDRIKLEGIPITPAEWRRFERVEIVACGTAYHAGLLGKRLIEQLIRVPTEAVVASEFRYSDPLVDEKTLVLLISQSGETADTLAAMREAKQRGAYTLAIVNVMGSTLAREAGGVIYTQAGPEIGVASTKAYLAQLVVIHLLAIHWAQQIGAPSMGDGASCSVLVNELKRLPELVAGVLQGEPCIKSLADRLADRSCFIYLGRGYDFAAAMEAALKLKEISYIHAEAYAAGEMKHGPLALIEPGVVVIGLATQPLTNAKLWSNLKEVKARNGTVVVVHTEGEAVQGGSDYQIPIPSASPSLMPAIAMVPLQLLAYHIANARGCQIDQPRNLAKSVTVE
ncbi:MAG: glutamine--fructose-6-phosphate transaminase (isomerizing) [Armatimonadetes bacterium]|nr:glutamine--fructose-6-phosphate transaminase (isomerizing) [Armatimonadota bacterium]